jgi:hypothetical protein
MKLLLGLLSGLLILFSCSKSNGKNDSTEDYLGIYTSTNKDTIKVSNNGVYAKFIFRNYESIHTPIPPPTTPNPIGMMEPQITMTFDSVRVAADKSFTTNETCTLYTYYTGTIFPLPPSSSGQGVVTGYGTFGTNTISLSFNIDGGTFNFSGIKIN